MGIGLVAVVNGNEAEAAVMLFEKLGERAWVIGELVKGPHEAVIE
jgi:phosphoribosylformylglycinamidine cyclo-ligase